MRVHKRALFTRLLAVLLPLGTATLSPVPGVAQATITTFAGTGVPGFSGDGGPAVQAQLNLPHGVAVDGAGNVYVADTNNHRIRKVDPSGTTATFAGTGVPGFSGDGGPAVQAQLNLPGDVAVDGAGNVYVADPNNHRIRRLDSSGTITTIAGTGVSGFSGDGGPAVQARLNSPHGVAVDGSGNVFIADTNNHRIRRLDSSGTITTIAGTGVSGFSGDGGAAVQAQLYLPHGVAVDGSGNVFIADTNNHRIRRLDSSGTITTIAGTGVSGFSGDGGAAVQAQLYLPHGVAVDGSGNVFIADTNNHRIRRLDSSGTITTIAGTGVSGFSGDGGAAVQAQLYLPHGVAVDGSGNIYIADTNNHRIFKLPLYGRVSESLPDAVERAGLHNGGVESTDSISRGTITYYLFDGTVKTQFDVTLILKGVSKVQRIVHQDGVDVRTGTDGSRTWHSLSIGFSTSARGQSLHFIESQTVRSVRSFLDHENQGLTLRDVSRFAGGRVVEATGPEGHQTDYIIDDETSHVTQLRFLTGGAKFDMFGNVYLAGEAYLFSDFRDVDGIPTPFKVVRRIDAGGVAREFEEMVFTSVSHNTGVSDSEFRP